jgi:hypothetical protein
MALYYLRASSLVTQRAEISWLCESLGPMSGLVSIAQLTFSDGRTVSLRPGSTLVIVGPNNSGKSHALRDIRARLARGPGEPPEPTLVLTEIEVQVEGNDDDLIGWLDGHTRHRPPGPGEQRQFHWVGGSANESRAREIWNNGPPSHLGELSAAFFGFADGAQRLTLAQSQAVPDLATQPPNTPLAVLYEDQDRERELTEATTEAFGMPVAVNRVAGGQVHLHLGEVPSGLGDPLPTNQQYRDALAALPRIESQGDGLRAYVGLLLMVIAAEHAAVIVDEPEAFLHPPQERALGRRLAREVRESELQLIMATHSLDVLLGALSAADTELTVLRVRRDGGINKTAVLEPEAVRRLWNDPIIRYSNTLDGIFHRGVVVCEGDGDARFYDATLQALRARRHEGEHGLLFLHCGGKHRVPVIVDALRALDVPVKVICDIDVLREMQPLRVIVESLGGDWESIRGDSERLRTEINGRAVSRRRLDDVGRDIAEYLSRVEGDPYLTKEIEKQVGKLAHADDAWSIVKQTGVSGIPAGQAVQTWERLDAALRELGLFVVPVGTLERWDATVGNRGPKWVVEVLENGLHERDGSHADFMGAVDASID